MLNGTFINCKLSCPVHGKKAYEDVAVKLYSFLNLTLDRGEWSASSLGYYDLENTKLSSHSWDLNHNSFDIQPVA